MVHSASISGNHADCVAVDAVARRCPVAADSRVIQVFAFLNGGVECLLEPYARGNLERRHSCLVQNQAEYRFALLVRFCLVQQQVC